MPASPTPPPGFKPPNRDVIPLPKSIRGLPPDKPTSYSKAELVDLYYKAYEQGWTDSAAHYEIEEYKKH